MQNRYLHNTSYYVDEEGEKAGSAEPPYLVDVGVDGKLEARLKILDVGNGVVNATLCITGDNFRGIPRTLLDANGEPVRRDVNVIFDLVYKEVKGIVEGALQVALVPKCGSIALSNASTLNIEVDLGAWFECDEEVLGRELDQLVTRLSSNLSIPAPRKLKVFLSIGTHNYGSSCQSKPLRSEPRVVVIKHHPIITLSDVLWLVIPAIVVFAALVLFPPAGAAVAAVVPAMAPYMVFAAASLIGSILLTAARYTFLALKKSDLTLALKKSDLTLPDGTDFAPGCIECDSERYHSVVTLDVVTSAEFAQNHKTTATVLHDVSMDSTD